MDYGMISKIEKAKMYAEERNRIQFNSFQAQIQGDNNEAPHMVSYDAGMWNCDCDFFGTRGRCSHTMALERILTEMVELG